MPDKRVNSNSGTLGDFHFLHLGLCDILWLFAAKGVWFIDFNHAHVQCSFLFSSEIFCQREKWPD